LRKVLGGGSGNLHTDRGIVMNGAVYKIYRNCVEHMKNTPEDWKKALDAFRKIWTPERDEEIQRCILRLEEMIYGEIKGNRDY